MRFFRPSGFAALIYPEALFRIETSEKKLFLTFDDGPDPASTPELLETLDNYGIKALFFCNGSSAGKYPELTDRIIAEGHQKGNHGFLHLNGWKTGCRAYCDNAYAAGKLTSEKLFRPPHGNLTPCQYNELKKKYRIIFWDVMAYDFDRSFGPGRSLAILNNKVRPGSIIVLHDSAGSTCLDFLKEFIATSLSKGFSFGIIK